MILRCSKISDDGVEQLWRDINQNFKNLQDLALYFPWYFLVLKIILMSDQKGVQISQMLVLDIYATTPSQA